MSWIFIALIIIGIIAYANPNLWQSVKQEVMEKSQAVKSKAITVYEQDSTTTDKEINPITNIEINLVSICREKFNDCNKIYNKKFGLSTSISEIEQINYLDEAIKFYNIWIERLPDWNRIGIEDRERTINESGFPQVLIAYSYNSPLGDVKLPSIAICNEEGELTQDSKVALSCG